MKSGYNKNLVVIFLSLLISFLIIGCGNQSVIPDAYVPGDYEEDSGFTVPNTPFDKESKFVDNAISITSWVTQEELEAFQEAAVMLLFGGPSGRNSGGTPTPPPPLEPPTLFKQLSTSQEAELIHFAMTLDAENLKVYTDGEGEDETAVEFEHVYGEETFTLNGFEYSLDMTYLLAEDVSKLNIIGNKLSREDIASLYNYDRAKQSLVLKYDFENISFKTVEDPINNNHARVMGNASITKGTNNRIASMNMNSYFVADHDSSLSFNNEFSFSAWIYNKSNGRTFMQIIDKGSTKDNYDLLLYRDELLFFYTDGGTNYSKYIITRGMDIRQNEWVHIGMVIKESGAEFYLNGESVYTKEMEINLSTNSDPLYIGRRNYGSSSYYDYKGMMDEICLFNEALTGDEMKAVYRSSFIK